MMIWDEQHVKALLRLPRYPKKLLEEEPWAGWLRERRGTNVVRESLRRVPLKPLHGQLLEMILNDPSAPPFRRAAAFHVSQGTYFRYLDVLVTALTEYLNAPAQENALFTNPATNLPVPLTPLIGAETTLQRITTLLARPHVRLVTLMGTGGIGKTRLALQAARHILEGEERRAFSDGIFWVDLAPLRTPGLVLVEIARVLNLTERRGYQTLELLQHELSERKVLLLLDNFEHLLAAVPLVAALLQRTSQVKILVTSRAALNISGEQRLPVPLLGLPGLDPLPIFERLNDYSAIQLFVQRAQEIDETFTLTSDNALVVAQLCTAFDGLPLALELAAKRLSHLSPQQMLTMLGQRLQLLTGGSHDVAPRHQTLRNLIDWSHQLLDAHQQVAFRRLAVFANGWTLEAMEAICVIKDEGGRMKDKETSFHPLDTLAALIHQSIVSPQFSEQSGDAMLRFGLLETIREYAQEKLVASGEEAIISQRHAAYYLSLVEVWTQTDVEPFPLAKLEREYHNLRNALQWAIEQSQSELALDLAFALWHYWTRRGSPNEGQYWLTRVLAVKPLARNPKRIRVLIDMGEAALYQNNFQLAQVLCEEAATLARELDNRRDLGTALQGLGEVVQFQGDYARARNLYLESLALHHEIEDERGMGWALDRLGNLALEQSLLDEASSSFIQSLALFQAQSYPYGIAHARAKLGLIAFEQRDYAAAAGLFESSLAQLQPQTSDWHYAWLIEYLGEAALGLGDLERAAGLFRQSLAIHFEGKAFQGVAYSLHGLATVALAEGQSHRAVRLLSGVQLIFDRYPPPPPRRRQLEASVARSRSLLDFPDFTAAWREGQTLSLEQIVAEEIDLPR